MITTSEAVLKLQVIEHKERLLNERQRQVMAKQYDLLQDEGRLRCDLQRLENEQANLLGN